MDEKILKEIKQIRLILSEMLGTSELPKSEKFSKEAIAKVAKVYKDLSIERKQWISSDDIHNVIKGAPWSSGKVIIEKFAFSNYFKRGRTLYFNRKDLMELNTELKKRNINLGDYIELLNDQASFKKYLENIKVGKGKRFKIPENLRDINSAPYSPPIEDIVINEINTLMEDYRKFALAEYITLYHDKTYAMFKYDYDFDRYIEPQVKKFCRDWCFKFNYANNALNKIRELKKSQQKAE